MSGIKDPYAVLGVDRYAQDSEIRESYERRYVMQGNFQVWHVP